MTQPKKPTDLGQDFIDSGMRLITQQSSDHLLSDLDEGRPQTFVDELDYWCNEFPTLERREIEEILEAIELDKTNSKG